MNIWWRTAIVLSILLVLVMGTSTPAQAAVFDEDGHIGADEVINDDVFLSGEQVVVDGTVNGVLLVTGETVTINGTVNGDLFVFGNNIIISPQATVDGNLFVGSRSAQLEGSVTGSFFGGAATAKLGQEASVGRNLYYGGYNFEMVEGSSISRDLFVGGYQAILAGTVERNAAFGGSALELTGEVGQDVRAEVGSGEMRVFFPTMSGQEDLPAAMDPGLRIAEGATIGGQLVYTSQTRQDQAIQSAPAGGIVYQTPVPNEDDTIVATQPINIINRYPVLEWLWGVLRNGITLLVFGALALWLLPRLFQRTVNQARIAPAPAAGYGLLTIFGGYFSMLVAVVLILLIGLLLSFISLGGLSSPVFGIGFSSLALFVALFTLMVSTVSKVIFSYLIGQLLLDRAAPQAPNRHIWALIAGVAIYVLVRSIPFVGWIAGLAATLIGVGAMWLAYQAWRNPRVEGPALQTTQEGA